MQRLFLTLLFVLFLADAAAAPKREVRAAWIATAYGLDWPRTKAPDRVSMLRQQAELCSLLDSLRDAGINTVLFQARVRGGVLYASQAEPWAGEVLTGRSGGSPLYDPLAFAIAECHRRGMECHAWMVTLPWGSMPPARLLRPSASRRQAEAGTVRCGSEYYLDPARPEARRYLADRVAEVVENYDVDGIQLDYLRYPEQGDLFPDTRLYRQQGQGRTLHQWRRDNLTELLRMVYRQTKRRKPWVRVSVCPVGKLSDTARYPSRGWNARDAVCQDAGAWLAEGIVDALYPMLYFRGNDFYPFLLQWQEQAHGRHIVAGIGIYFLAPGERQAWSRADVLRQLHFLRRNGAAGACFYRARHLAGDVQGIAHAARHTFYASPALPPAMTWMDSIPPSSPRGLRAVACKPGYTELTWQASADNDRRNAPAYVVYASDSLPVDTRRAEHIVAAGVRDTTYVYAPALPWERRRYFAVTAIDRYGNESAPVQLR